LAASNASCKPEVLVPGVFGPKSPPSLGPSGDTISRFEGLGLGASSPATVVAMQDRLARSAVVPRPKPRALIMVDLVV
jgi:hypothetical protein